jgi:hypothetical protein
MRNVGTAVVQQLAAEPLSPWPVWFSVLYGVAAVCFVLGIVVAAVRYGSQLRLDQPAPRHARHQVASPSTPASPATSRVPAMADPVEPRGEREELDGPVPPSWLRPGQLRLLRDGRADGVAVTATLVDLAVRRFLRIQEVRRDGSGRPTDWVLDRRTPPAERLLPYEQTLLSALFPDREMVTMSTLRRSAGSDWRRVQEQIIDDAVGRGWFAQSEVELRAAKRSRGRRVVLLGVGLGLGNGLLHMLGFRLLPSLVLVLIVLGIIALGLWMSQEAGRRPWRRSPAGDAVLTDVEPYCAELAAAGTDGVRPECASAVFSRSLPYAIALDLATEWSARFGRMPQVVGAASSAAWYGGSTGGVLGMHEGVCAFATAADCTWSGSGGSGGSGYSDSGGGWGGDWGGGGGGGGGGGDSGGGSS